MIVLLLIAIANQPVDVEKQILIKILVETDYIDSTRAETINPVFVKFNS